VNVENIIQVQDLVKVYPGDVKALSGIDFSECWSRVAGVGKMPGKKRSMWCSV